MTRQQQIKQLTDASTQLTGVLDRLRSQDSTSGPSRTAHSSESATSSSVAERGTSGETDREILNTISVNIQAVSESL